MITELGSGLLEVDGYVFRAKDVVYARAWQYREKWWVELGLPRSHIARIGATSEAEALNLAHKIMGFAVL